MKKAIIGLFVDDLPSVMCSLSRNYMIQLLGSYADAEETKEILVFVVETFFCFIEVWYGWCHLQHKTIDRRLAVTRCHRLPESLVTARVFAGLVALPLLCLVWCLRTSCCSS